MDTPTVDVTLRVNGIDLDDYETGNTLSRDFPFMLWHERDGMITMTMAVSADDPLSETVETCRKMEAALPGLKFIGVDRDFVSVTDIATRVDLTREAVRKWTGHKTFPAPQGMVGRDSVKFWAWTEVVEWLQTHRGLALDEDLLSVAQMTQLENCLMLNPDHTTSQWHSLGASASMAFPRVTEVGSYHRGVFEVAARLDLCFEGSVRVQPAASNDAPAGLGQGLTGASRRALVEASMGSRV